MFSELLSGISSHWQLSLSQPDRLQLSLYGIYLAVFSFLRLHEASHQKRVYCRMREDSRHWCISATDEIFRGICFQTGLFSFSSLTIASILYFSSLFSSSLLASSVSVRDYIVIYFIDWQTLLSLSRVQRHDFSTDRSTRAMRSFLLLLSSFLRR